MKDIRGAPINPVEITVLLTSLGKTNEECWNFFGGELWETPGFAIEFLRHAAATKAWAVQHQKGWQ